MREFKWRKKRIRLRDIAYSRAVLVALAAALFFSFSAAWGMYGKYRETEEKKDLALEKLEELEKREQFVRSELARLGTKRGVEEEIRGKLGLAKEGEGVIIIVDPQSGNGNASREEQENFFQKMLGGNIFSIFGKRN